MAPEPPDPHPTRWLIRREGSPFGQLLSPTTRHFAVGDLVNLPPPAGRGSIWRVIAIELGEPEGCDGTLEVESAPDPRPPEAAPE
jgi:hypothetical protein